MLYVFAKNNVITLVFWRCVIQSVPERSTVHEFNFLPSQFVWTTRHAAAERFEKTIYISELNYEKTYDTLMRRNSATDFTISFGSAVRLPALPLWCGWLFKTQPMTLLLILYKHSLAPCASFGHYFRHLSRN